MGTIIVGAIWLAFFRVTHSTNEDLHNIEHKGYPKSCTSDTTETRNLCAIKVICSLVLLILIFFNSLNLFWHTDKNFCFYVEVNFWDFVRNDSFCFCLYVVAINRLMILLLLNETRYGPKKKSSPIYLGPKNLETFWCTGWAW